jgi:hypothetical protein
MNTDKAPIEGHPIYGVTTSTTEENDTPDDGLAICALAVAVLVIGILGGLAWLVSLVF